jgi:hypothetical protein
MAHSARAGGVKWSASMKGCINEGLKAIEAAKAVLSTTNPNSETIRVLRQAKYIAAMAMTTFPSDKPLNDARHAVEAAN